MRYYTIVITPPTGSTAFKPITYTTLQGNGTPNGSALKIDIDIFQTWYHQPAQNGYLKIYGVDFSTLNDSANLNPIGDKYCSIQVFVGMSKGLPYANPKQINMIIDGSIVQAFGNWQGNETSLDLIIIPATYIPDSKINLQFTWQMGQTLQDAVTQTLNTAYKNPAITGKFSPDLVYTEVQPARYKNLTSFSKDVNKLSKQVNSDPNYSGASIAKTPNGFYLWDGTENRKAVVQVAFQDIVGNITWIDTATIQAKLVMRADLNIGDTISFPKGIPFINVAGSYSQLRFGVNFNGLFTINSIRHVGASRQPDGNSWVTIVECIILSGAR